MDNQVKQTTDGKAKLEAWKAYLAKRRACSPSNTYFFATVGACLLCFAAFVALLWLDRTPDGAIDPMAMHQWEVAHPVWSSIAMLVLMATCVAMCDLCGWKYAVLIAGWRYRENITIRRVATLRLALQTVFAVLMVLLYAAFPTMFPHPNGRPPYLGLGILCVPIALAAIQLFRASNTQKTKE